mgnify:CR=1 FL=1
MLVIDLLIMLLPILDHRVQYRSQLLACCHHCRKISAFLFYVSEVTAHRVVRPIECVGILTQRLTDKILFVRHATGRELAARYLVVRHQTAKKVRKPNRKKMYLLINRKVNHFFQYRLYISLFSQSNSLRNQMPDYVQLQLYSSFVDDKSS